MHGHGVSWSSENPADHPPRSSGPTGGNVARPPCWWRNASRAYPPSTCCTCHPQRPVGSKTGGSDPWTWKIPGISRADVVFWLALRISGKLRSLAWKKPGLGGFEHVWTLKCTIKICKVHNSGMDVNGDYHPPDRHSWYTCKTVSGSISAVSPSNLKRVFSSAAAAKPEIHSEFGASSLVVLNLQQHMHAIYSSI